MATRYLKFTGTVGTDNPRANIFINDQLVYTGIIGENATVSAQETQPESASELVTITWEGSDNDPETVSVVIDITEGTVRVGPILADVELLGEDNTPINVVWDRPNSDEGDGRTNITINDIEPIADVLTTNNWNGWCLQVAPPDVFKCNYLILPKIPAAIDKTILG